MAYLTKNPNGVIFLWNNKPHYNDYGETYMAWISGFEGQHNEIPIEVTSNEYFRSIFKDKEPPVMIEFSLQEDNSEKIHRFTECLEQMEREFEDTDDENSAAVVEEVGMMFRSIFGL